jgi:exonuclease III
MSHYLDFIQVCGLKSDLYHKLAKLYPELIIYYEALKRITTLKNECKNHRHLTKMICKMLQNDIEPNPGPSTDILALTLNCRGLNNTNKLRLVLTKCAAMVKDLPNTILMLQETMIVNNNYLELVWKGKHIFTPGTGNSQGCITLLNYESQILNQTDFDNRGHMAEIVLPNQEKITIYNIYAPNGYAQDKRHFFENIVAHLGQSRTWNVMLAGDFNLTLTESDRYNRQTCQGEKNISRYLSTELSDLGLNDNWLGYDGMTWRRGTSMSRLDRIYSKISGYRLKEIKIDWTLCESDHAAVIATFNPLMSNKCKIKPCRLNSRVLQNNESLSELKNYLREQLLTIDQAEDPHMTLEFAKMTIRTKALQLGKKHVKEEEEKLRFINEEIKSHERLLKGTFDPNEQIELSSIIQTKINERNHILNAQGENLAWKFKTKWYNEGERSNKYFLNLMNSGTSKNEMTKLKIDDNIINDPNNIAAEVNNFYTRLYNLENTTLMNNADLLREMFEVDRATAVEINRPITLGELWLALKPLKDTAPGPDGISHAYLKRLWDIIGPLIVNAWNHSIRINKMPPSHYKSFLKLIPKAGKDITKLTNWRPITLSNCDHELITRVYNNRLLAVIGPHIINTQTAYIKSRNITDNIRIINAAIQLAQKEPDINGAIVALDAQKAFDTVNHKFLETVLARVGLANFNPIFNLLYKGINNDMLINGEIKGNHLIQNGVKQGDALSCTLFILAMEPLIRNIQKNINIKPIESRILQFTWPKVYGYADDITCVIENDQASKQAIFTEYENFTKASGLTLNADKTEIYEFGFGDLANGTINTKITYLNNDHNIVPVQEIKINGVYLSQNLTLMKNTNSKILIDKMDQHFGQWSKRNLSLLGKIQIYKTFGLSQFLYHLSVYEPTQIIWKNVTARIHRFLWNKTYNLHANQAPVRIKRSTMEAPVKKGGFGMIDIKKVVTALRLRRHLTLINENVHPLHELINSLTADNDYFSTQVLLYIEEVTKLNLNVLQEKRLKDLEAPDWQLESDLFMHEAVLKTRLANLVRPRKLRSREATRLLSQGDSTLSDLMRNHFANINPLKMIVRKEMQKIISILARLYGVQPPLQVLNNLPSYKLRDKNGTWLAARGLTSQKIRDILSEPNLIVTPKIMLLEEDVQLMYYSKLARLLNIANRTKILRLLQGDVYTAERMKRFNMSDTDRCRRCFAKETIIHLLTECPYTVEVLNKLNIPNTDISEIIGVSLNLHELEIRSDLVISLVFRMQTMPPDVLIQTTIDKYARGLAVKPRIKQCAERMRQLI